MSHRNFRQDWNSNLWRAEGNGATHRLGLRTRGSDEACCQPRALLKTPVIWSYSRDGPRATSPPARSDRGHRAAWAWIARGCRWPASADHEFEKLMEQKVVMADQLPLDRGGLECVAAIDDHYAATFR